MWVRLCVAFGLSVLVLTGCAVTPDFRLARGVSPQSVVRKIQCELASAAKEYDRLIEGNWVATTILYLQVDEDAGLTPSLSFIEPLIHGSFAFGASGKLSGSTQRIYNETFSVDIRTLAKRLDPTSPFRHKLNRDKFCTEFEGPDYGITGDLGIVEVVGLAFRSVEADDPSTTIGKFKKKEREEAAAVAEKQGGKDDSVFGQTIQFAVTKNVNAVGPTWTITRFKGPGGLFGAARTDTHKLVISFVSASDLKLAPGRQGYANRINAAKEIGLNNNQLLLQQGLPQSILRQIQQ